jgi:DNA-directed RNA polymerase specialized sigma24 family protein
MPKVSSISLAEMRVLVQETQSGMDPLDRELLTLRHLAERSSSEVAQMLGLSRTTASNRHTYAFERPRQILAGLLVP